MLIARTQPRESHSQENTVIYTEYRIRKLSQAERDQHVDEYVANRLYSMDEVWAQERQVVWETNGQRNEKGWDVLDWSSSADKAAWSFGDSNYYKAESLHPLHRTVVERHNRYVQLHQEKRELEASKIDIKQKYMDLYHAELKRRKLYSKAMKGTAPQDIILGIMEPLRAQYRVETDDIDKQLANVDKELIALSK